MQMRAFAAISFLAIATFAAYGQQRTPKMTSADTPSGKKGDVVAFSGENLGTALLEKVYLTDGEHDFQIVFAEQTFTTLKFRIPEGVPAGRFAFMAKTAGKDGKFIELPRFRMTIDQRMQTLWDNIENFLVNLRKLPLWVNRDLSATVFGGKQNYEFWQTIFETGKTSQGQPVIPSGGINLMKMIQSH